MNKNVHHQFAFNLLLLLLLLLLLPSSTLNTMNLMHFYKNLQ
jgi:hypothetical protein